MQQWEYIIAESETGFYKGNDCTKPFIQRLNKLGKGGWETVGVSIDKVTFYTRPIVVLLRRPTKN